jgi:hypothetical protein
MRFEYVVWFRDLRLDPEDPDHEWPACFLVHAKDAAAAQRWGDVLSHQREVWSGEVFMWSRVESSEPGQDSASDALPEVWDGKEASADHIGW